MDVVTLFFAVIVSLLLTKYLPPHSTYQETVNSLKDEIQKIPSKLAEFTGDLKGLKAEISAEVQKATDEISKLKEDDGGDIKAGVEKVASKIEALDGILNSLKADLATEIQKATEKLSKAGGQKTESGTEELKNVVAKLGELDNGLKELGAGIETQLRKVIDEFSKLSSIKSGDDELKGILDKLSQVDSELSSIKSELAGEVQKVTNEVNQIKLQNDVLTAFIEETKKAKLPEQFELYNGLWISLVELKTIANDLWEYPSRDKAKKFSKQVLETRKMLEQSAIFIPEALFNKLMDIIQEFENMQFGKVSLVKLRSVTVKNKDFPESDLKAGLSSSDEIKNNYISALEELKKYIREHVVETK